MKGLAFNMVKAIPAKAAVATVLKKNRNKVFYATELFKEITKIAPITYSSLCSSLCHFDYIKIPGDYRFLYGHPAALKKAKKELHKPALTSQILEMPTALIIQKAFKKYKTRVLTPIEWYTLTRDNDGYGAASKMAMKACLLNHFPRISLSKAVSYYGSKDALKEFQMYLRRNDIAHKYITPR